MSQTKEPTCPRVWKDGISTDVPGAWENGMPNLGMIISENTGAMLPAVFLDVGSTSIL